MTQRLLHVLGEVFFVQVGLGEEGRRGHLKAVDSFWLVSRARLRLLVLLLIEVQGGILLQEVFWFPIEV